MGWFATSRFIARGARSKGRNAYFRKFMPAHRQWPLMKAMLNDLVKNQRLETTLPRAKELQQYAEELVFMAKRNTEYHDGVVDSMLNSAEARRILFERMVPRYQDRPFHFTRIVNQFKYRERDTAQMAYIEYVDRAGEFRPAKPVGAARDQWLASEFLQTRQGRRRHLSAMQRMLSRPQPPSIDAEVLERCRYEVQQMERRYASGQGTPASSPARVEPTGVE